MYVSIELLTLASSLGAQTALRGVVAPGGVDNKVQQLQIAKSVPLKYLLQS